jgi:hypothetical protein
MQQEIKQQFAAFRAFEKSDHGVHGPFRFLAFLAKTVNVSPLHRPDES